MLTSSFLSEFKRTTEAKWSTQLVHPDIYGFQFQAGTRWNPGLSEEQIAEYADLLAVVFPNDFRGFLRGMNGTDLSTLNVYGSCGEPHRQSVGVHSYPRDMAIVTRLVEEVGTDRGKLATTRMEQGFHLPPKTTMVPIYSHRYLACTPDPGNSAVLSIVGDEAIVYGNSLKEYLEREFL